MKNKNNMNVVWLIVCIICLVVFVVLGICSVSFDVLASDGTEFFEEAETSTIESIVSGISGTSEDIALQIEMWQEYIDKYIMPNALAVITGLSMVFAVFSKFKYLVNLYNEDKEAFNLEKTEIFSSLKEEVSSIMSSLTDVKETTLATIDNMPISSIQEDLSKAKEALEKEMESIQDFTKMFEIFLKSERKMMDTSYLPTKDKQEMKKLFYEGEMLAKKNQATLSDVSDFVLATISGSEQVSEIEELESGDFKEEPEESQEVE